MKKTILLALAPFALIGCMQGPQSTEEVRAATAGGSGINSLFAKRTSINVSRSHAAVTASLRAGAKKCMNRVVRSTSTTPGPYGPQTSTIITDYSATVKSSGGRSELALKQQVRGGFLPQPGGISYVVDATPISGGTKLVFHGGKFGYSKLNAAVSQWARGGSIVCPDLPGSG